MSKKDKPPHITFSYDKSYIGFIKAMASRNVNLCWKFADQLRQYDTKANEAIKVVEEWININREKKKVDAELHDLKIKAKNLQEQNTRLTYQKSPMLNKKQSQTASIVQFVDLLTKKKYQKANNASNPAHREMAKNLWEYDCLKKYSENYRSPGEKIEEPKVQSTPYYHIKNRITVKKDEIDTVHRQYTQALRGIFNFNLGKKQFKSITKQNMLLMQSLERRLTNKQIQIRNNYEQFSVKECQNSIKEEEFERFSCEIQENRKARIYQSQPTNLQEQKPKQNLQMQWNRLDQIQKLLDKIQGRNSTKFIDKTDYLNSVNIVLHDVSKCLKSLPQIKKPNNPLAQTYPVPQQHNTDNYEYWERKAILDSLEDRIKQMQNRQKQIKQKMIKINKIILQVQLDESIPLWIDEYTQEDEIIENTIKNAQILVKQFNLTKKYLVEARKHAKSVIMVQSEPQPQSEPDRWEVIEKVQENNFQGEQLVRVQDYIQKIQLLEQINNNLTKENKQFVEQIVRIKDQLENTQRALEQLKNDKSNLEEQRKNLNTTIQKQMTKIKAIERSTQVDRSSFQEQSYLKESRQSRNSKLYSPSIMKCLSQEQEPESDRSILKSPPNLLESRISMEENIHKQKIIEELQKQIETLKQKHKDEKKELQNTIEQLTREGIDQKLKLEHIEQYNKDLLNQKKQKKSQKMKLQEELIKVSNERNDLIQQLNSKLQTIACLENERDNYHKLSRSKILETEDHLSQNLSQSNPKWKSSNIPKKLSVEQSQLISLKEEVDMHKSANQQLTTKYQQIKDKLSYLNNVNDQMNRQIQNYREQQKKFRQKIVYLKKKLQYTQNKRDEENHQKEEKIKHLEQQNSTLKAEIKQQQLEIKKKTIQLEQKNKETEELANQLSRCQTELQNQDKNQNRQIDRQEQVLALTNAHLFTAGDLFDEGYNTQRLDLITKLQKQIGVIKRTKLLYRYDPYNKVNFHKYIDNQKHIVLVMKTIYGKLVAAYSQESFNPNGVKKGPGYLIPLWNEKIYRVNKNFRAITYDEYYIIYGNSEVRIKSLETKVFCNFGLKNGFYESKGDGVNEFLGEPDREVDILGYEVYQLVLEKQTW